MRHYEIVCMVHAARAQLASAEAAVATLDATLANLRITAPFAGVVSVRHREPGEILGAGAPVESLTKLREWNVAHRSAGSMKYEQARLDASDSLDLEKAKAAYEADRAQDIRLNGTHGIDEVMQAQQLDALLFAGGGGAGIAAKPGNPTVIVPFGFVPNDQGPPFPEGWEAKPQPLGVSFTGRASSEPRLLELAYAFGQATNGGRAVKPKTRRD